MARFTLALICLLAFATACLPGISTTDAGPGSPEGLSCAAWRDAVDARVRQVYRETSDCFVGIASCSFGPALTVACPDGSIATTCAAQSVRSGAGDDEQALIDELCGVARAEVCVVDSCPDAPPDAFCQPGGDVDGECIDVIPGTAEDCEVDICTDGACAPEGVSCVVEGASCYTPSCTAAGANVTCGAALRTRFACLDGTWTEEVEEFGGGFVPCDGCEVTNPDCFDRMPGGFMEDFPFAFESPACADDPCGDDCRVIACVDGAWVEDVRRADVAPDCPATDAGVVDGGADAGPVDAGVTCTTPVIAPLPFNTTSFTALVLDGTGSAAPAPHAVSGWTWTVQPPRPLAIQVTPDRFSPTANYVATVSGTYTVELQVSDDTDAGVECTGDDAIASRQVTVVPEADLQIELTWITEADPAPGDTSGVDADLHLLTPTASRADSNGDGLFDGWYDQQLDCFWFNTSPNLGDPMSLADDPRLFGDDVDGAGPEITTIDEVDPALGFTVGVHIYDDHLFGPSEVRVDVWVGGVKAFTLDRTLNHHDFWEVVDIVPTGPMVIDEVTNLPPPSVFP